MTLSEFPSPQGGSETWGSRSGSRWADCVSIPSRRVGDVLPSNPMRLFFTVSIPSRRVGDLTSSTTQTLIQAVSIPSRRVGDSPSFARSSR